MLVYEWYIARVALPTPVPGAALVVIVDLLLGALIGHVANTLY